MTFIFKYLITYLKASMDWCIENNFRGTPVTLVDGYNLPKVYEAADLKWLLMEYKTEAATKET